MGKRKKVGCEETDVKMDVKKGRMRRDGCGEMNVKRWVLKDRTFQEQHPVVVGRVFEVRVRHFEADNVGFPRARAPALATRASRDESTVVFPVVRFVLPNVTRDNFPLESAGGVVVPGCRRAGARGSRGIGAHRRDGRFLLLFPVLCLHVDLLVRLPNAGALHQTNVQVAHDIVGLPVESEDLADLAGHPPWHDVEIRVEHLRQSRILLVMPTGTVFRDETGTVFRRRPWAAAVSEVRGPPNVRVPPVPILAVRKPGAAAPTFNGP
jgi:hypothetical protein